VRGPDWVHGNQNGKQKDGKQNLGVNLRACPVGEWALVRWKKGNHRDLVMPYRYGVESNAGDGKPLFEVCAAQHQPSWGKSKPDSWGKEQIWCLPKNRTWVATTIQVVRIGNIDTVNEKFLAKLNVDLEWKASGEDLWEYLRLKHKSKFKPYWMPRLTFPTEIETVRENIMETAAGASYRLKWRAPQENHKSWTDLVEQGKNKRLRNLLYISVTRVIDIWLSDRFEMESFPLDCQDLKIVLQSYDPTERCEFCPFGTLIKDNSREEFCQIRRDTFTSSDWQFKSVCVSSEKTFPQNDIKNESYSKLVVRLKLQRKWELYFFRVCIIMCLLSVTNMSSFYIPLDDIGDRMANNVGFVFTAIAFQFVINSYLPHISYLTVLDCYVLGVFIFMLMITFQTCLIAGNEELDQICFTVFFVGIVLYHGIFIFIAWRARNKEKEKLEARWEDEQFEDETDLFVNNTPIPCGHGKLLFCNVHTRSIDAMSRTISLAPVPQFVSPQSAPVPVPGPVHVPVPVPSQSVDQGVRENMEVDNKFPQTSENDSLIMQKYKSRTHHHSRG